MMSQLATGIIIASVSLQNTYNADDGACETALQEVMTS
jgi:hypothetical protein